MTLHIEKTHCTYMTFGTEAFLSFSGLGTKSGGGGQIWSVQSTIKHTKIKDEYQIGKNY